MKDEKQVSPVPVRTAAYLLMNLARDLIEEGNGNSDLINDLKVHSTELFKLFEELEERLRGPNDRN